jgi:dihydroflavonol-4-reductase
MRGCEHVIHLANVYSYWERDRSVYARVNVDGTRHVLEAALECDIAKVAHVSTCLVYGRPADNPFTEASQPGPVRLSTYAETKYQGDQLAWALHAQRGLPLVVLYPGAVLRPGDDRPSGQYIDNLISGRIPARTFVDSVMTYVHVDDVVQAILGALDQPNNLGERYLIGNQCLTYRAYVDLVCQIAGVPPPRRSISNASYRRMARVATAVANLSGRPPWIGMALDGAETSIIGVCFDGSKAVRDLGVRYTPIEVALEQAIASRLGAPPRTRGVSSA